MMNDIIYYPFKNLPVYYCIQAIKTLYLFWVASGFGQYQDSPLANPGLQCSDWG